MCRVLMPGDEESMSDEAIWETLPHFWVAISMVFLIAATIFLLLKLCGDVDALGWWDLFINFGIAECFAFLVCTKWSNPMIHRRTYHEEPSSSSTTFRYHDLSSGILLSSLGDDPDQDSLCGLQDIGDHRNTIWSSGYSNFCYRLAAVSFTRCRGTFRFLKIGGEDCFFVAFCIS